MLNNVLVALSGIEGESFYFDNHGLPKSTLSVRYWEKCHPSEILALERVTTCGAFINEINRFKYPQGLYNDAIKFSIHDLLKDYYQDVVMCEMDITKSEEFYSLTHLETLFSKVLYHSI